MTKEEKIKKSYKRFWVQLQDEAQEEALRNNGFIANRFIGNEYGRLTNLLKMESKESIDEDNGESIDVYRPIELQGIENNNGWIKLESEDDFPEDNVTCWIIDKNLGIVSGKWINAPTEKQQVEAKNYWLENATHYQVIEEPKEPFY